jgi:uncharacterized protein (DUF1778 family)
MEEDEGYWDRSAPPELIEPAPPERRGTVFSVRMSQEQARLVGQAAEVAGMSVLDFIRDAAVQRATSVRAAAPTSH